MLKHWINESTGYRVIVRTMFLREEIRESLKFVRNISWHDWNQHDVGQDLRHYLAMSILTVLSWEKLTRILVDQLPRNNFMDHISAYFWKFFLGLVRVLSGADLLLFVFYRRSCEKYKGNFRECFGFKTFWISELFEILFEKENSLEVYILEFFEFIIEF